MKTHDTPIDDLPLDDDAVITAFALGELDSMDPSAAAAFAQRLEDDPALAAEIESIRAAGASIAQALGAEPAAELSAEQRASIAAGSARHDEPPVVYSFRRAFGTLGLAAAACFVIALVVLDDKDRVDPNAVSFAPGLEQELESLEDGLELRAANVSVPDAESFGAPFQPLADGSVAPTAAYRVPPGTAAMTDSPSRLDLRKAGASDFDSLGVPSPVGGAAAAPAEVLEAESTDLYVVADGGGLGGGGEPMSSSFHIADQIEASKREAGSASAGGASSRGRVSTSPMRSQPDSGSRRDVGVARELAMAETLEQLKEKGDFENDARAEETLGRRRGARGIVGDPADVGFGEDTAGSDDQDETRVVALIERQRADRAEREEYSRLYDTKFADPLAVPLDTRSADVDTASYSNVRRMLDQGMLPPPDAVRIEELINYFEYDYPEATGEHPFSLKVDTTAAPWNPQHRLVRIGLRGLEVNRDMRPATNLVFLVDVSGSMGDRNKLSLVKESLNLLVENLTPDDRIGIVTYAGSASVVLPSTYCHERERILSTIDGLRSGGSTDGGAGIVLAYDEARRAFIEGGVNRVILCTDGDFNVGVSSDGELVRLIERERESDVFLSVLGYGTGNYQDAKMEELSNHGNGNAAYIDSVAEARRVLVERMAGTLVTIAKDVKLQVEFNPKTVGAYRIIGYANRELAPEDFNDDRVDAGEIGAGHTMTALYEIVPRDADGPALAGRTVDELRYQRRVVTREAADEMLTVKLRYKMPEGDESVLLQSSVTDDGSGFAVADDDLRFAASVAGFGMLLRQSPDRGSITWEDLLGLLRQANTTGEPRAEFVRLVERAKSLVDEGS